MTDAVASNGLTTRLVSQVVRFLDDVRSEGVAVGVSGTLDLGRALTQVPILDRTAVRDASRVTLAKSPEDVRVVERVFDRFWRASEDGFFQTPTALEEALPRNPGPRSPRREPGRIQRSPIALKSDRELPIGVYSARAPSPGHPLVPVSARQMARFRSGSRRFRRECSTLPGRRSVARSWGDLDLVRTARRATRTGGEWVELAHRAPRLRRADLVILWDVSGSMREHDAEMFALVYALKRIVRSTRVFAFSTETVELTPFLAGMAYRRALGVVRDRLDTPGGGTQIAACLREFRRLWGSSIRPTTTVLVLSDGWDLGDADGLRSELRQLRHLAHRLVWVNPYAGRPGFVPSTAGMRAALPVLDLLTSPGRFPSPHGGPRPEPNPASLPARKGLSTSSLLAPTSAETGRTRPPEA